MPPITPLYSPWVFVVIVTLTVCSKAMMFQENKSPPQFHHVLVLRVCHNTRRSTFVFSFCSSVVNDKSPKDACVYRVIQKILVSLLSSTRAPLPLTGSTTTQYLRFFRCLSTGP